MSTQTKKRKRIDLKNATTKEILMFSLLPFGLLTIQNVIGNALNVYFTDILGLGMVATGLVLSATKIWDAINDPMMGMIVDKTRTRWGKCRPYLLWMAVPLMVATALLFAPVDFANSPEFQISQIDLASTLATLGDNFHVVRTAEGVNTGNFWYAVAAYLLFYTAYTAVDIPYQGLNPLLFPKNNVRVKAISLSNIFGAIGTILPSILFFPIVGFFPGEPRKGYFVAAIVFAVLAGIPILISFFGVKEKVYVEKEPIKYRKVLSIIFKDKNMRILLVVAFFTSITNLGAMFLMFFAKWNCYGIFDFNALNGWLAGHGLGLTFNEEGLLFPVLSITSGISYMLSMALIPPLLKKMSKKQLFIWSSLIFAALDVLIFVICMYVFPLNSPDLTQARIGFVVYAVLRFFTNFPVGISLVLLIAIFSDTVDMIEMRTGERLEGGVFSFRSLVNKFGVAGFNLIVMAIVNAFGYSSMTKTLTGMKDAGTLTREILWRDHTPVLNAIFAMLTILGAVGLVLQVLPMLRYKFDEVKAEKELAAYRVKRDAEIEAELAAALESKKESQA